MKTFPRLHQPLACILFTNITIHAITYYRLHQPLACPDSVFSLLESCWALEAERRPSFSCLYERFVGEMPRSVEARCVVMGVWRPGVTLLFILFIYIFIIFTDLKLIITNHKQPMYN